MKCGPDNCPITTFSDLTPAEQKVQRARWAWKLHQQGFTDLAISKQLGVSHQTIGRDLEEFVHDGQTQPRTSKRGRKGEGRPKGSNKRTTPAAPAQDPVRVSATPQEWDEFKRLTEAAGGSAAEMLGAVVKGAAIDPTTLSLSAQQKLEAAIRQHKHKLQDEFSARVGEKVKEVLDQFLPEYDEKRADAERILNAHQGILSKAQFRLVLACLSPDSRKGFSDQKLAEAFNVIKKLELVLVKKEEQEKPRSSFQFPRTYEEAMQMKREVAARRKNNKAGARSVQLA